MKYITEIIIFLLVLFVYLHIFYHQKVSNDYEIYELDEITNDKLNEVCDLRQPVVFYAHNNIQNHCSGTQLQKTFGGLDLKIRDVTEKDDSSEMYIPLTLTNTFKLLQNDNERKYITEKNKDFIQETGLYKEFKKNEGFFKPPLTNSSEYDIISGGVNTSTPLRYEMSYRNYFYVSEGIATIKLTPPINGKYLLTEKDFENFEFRSPINPWTIQKEYEKEYSKIRFIEIELRPGMMFHIPAYWWYTIKFNSNTTICNFKYKTIMNTISISPLIFVHFMQRLNIRRKYIQYKQKTKNKQENFESKQEKLERKIKEKKIKFKKKDNSKTDFNSFGQPKTIEEQLVENSTNEIKQVNTLSENNLIKPAVSCDMNSPNILKNDSTAIDKLSQNINNISSVKELSAE